MIAGRPLRLLVFVATIAAGATELASGAASTCERTIAREASKYAQARAKALRLCADHVVRGRLPAGADCESDPATAARLTQARAKLEASIGKACGGADGTCATGDDSPLAPDGWGGRPACLGLGTTSCAAPIANCADVAACVVCLADASVAETLDTSFGALDASSFGSATPLNGCQRALVKETAKYLSARDKALARCWDGKLKGAHANPCPAPGDGRTTTVLAKAEQKKIRKLCRACGGADRACNGAGDFAPGDIGFPPNCPDVTVPNGPPCGGTVGDLARLVECVDCIADYSADCLSAAAAPAATPYPPSCSGGGGSTTSSTATTPGSTVTTSTGPGTTTIVSTTTATTTSLPAGGSVVDFTTGTPGGVCGHTYGDTAGTTVLRDLACGGLDIGGGGAIVPEGPTPDGSTNRFAADCTGSACNLVPIGAPGPLYDCTAAGCNFGAPLPIPNGSLSVCVRNRFASPGSGTLDLATGAASLSVALTSEVVLTGDGAQPCPVCRVGSPSGPLCSGTPSSPCTGVCEGSGNQGAPCTSTSMQGLTRDCFPAATSAGQRCYRGADSGAACGSAADCPGGTCAQFVGEIPVDLSPLATGTAELSSPNGLFCPSQTSAGCFTNPNASSCRLIREIGQAAGPITPGVPATMTLASTFCVPATSNGIINASAALPGPGATSLPGRLLFTQNVTTTTAASTTSSTSTTSTSTAPTPTTTSTTSSTTTTTAAPGTVVLDFTTAAGSGACGVSRDGASAVIRPLGCGTLNLGGGASTVPEGSIPDGATSRFLVTGCAGSSCSLAPAAGGGPGVACTGAGCPFGPPLPIANANLSTCVVNTLSSAASGSVDTATGVMSASFPLSSHVFVTGNGTQPCPRCSAAGTPANPGTGTCDRGARATLGCTSTNSRGLSSDCPPGGSDGSSDLGTIPVNLAPAITGTASDSDPGGLFCPGQTTTNDNQGCFGSPACRSFQQAGMPAGPLAEGVATPVALAAAFCIPATGNLLIDGAASLPGPGTASLTGVATLRTLGSSSTTTTTTLATSTTTAPGTTTTSTSTSSSTTTSLLPLPPLTVELQSGTASGDCGAVHDGGGALIEPLACGDLVLGGGAGTIAPSRLPDGAVNRFTLNTADLGCVLSLLTACPIGPTATAGPAFDCTDTGCHFGPPVPVPNGGLSACSIATFAAPSIGTVNLLTGATSANVSLALHLFVTGNGAQPCPRCSATGSPGAPGTGACDRGARMGLSCTTTNSHGLSKDCAPGGSDGSVDLGTITADLSPVTTGTASKSNPLGIFCPAQPNAGCFGKPGCRSFVETGAAPNAALAAVTPQPATLVSTFCIPASGSVLLDGSANLPGPAAISLPGTIRASF